MKKLTQNQQKTLEILSNFHGKITDEVLKLFPKRSLIGLAKRNYLKSFPYRKDEFYVSQLGKINQSKFESRFHQNGALNNCGSQNFALLDFFRPISMARLTIRCPQCGKVAEITKTTSAFKQIFKTYSCGHMVVEKEIQLPSGRDAAWLRLRPYQQEGVEFLEKSNFQAILGDAPGLGKTPQTLMAIYYHFDELTPTLCVVKSSLKYQWATHYVDWALKDPSQLELMPYVITDGQMPILNGFKFYIIGMDLLKKKWQEFEKIGIKLVIVDESHNFKNGEAARTGALVKMIKTFNIPYRIFTSGTPILNRSTEFFTTLNLSRPDEWPSEIQFKRSWHMTDDKGRYTRIYPQLLDSFKTKISPYFLRREKREVLKDLPPFQRNFRLVDVEDSNIKRMYNAELDLLRNYMKMQELEEESDESRISLLAYLNKLRRIAGMAKVPACIEDTLEFLEYTADEGSEVGDKICIGLHHKAVMQSLKLAFESRGYNVVTISGEDNAEQKYEKEQAFKRSENRICLASTLAAGEGLNLQFCSMATQLERQWNAAKEEQFESRFDRFGQTRPTTCDYFVAKGTVDEFFSRMVEDKRNNCKETLGDELDIESNFDLLKKLAEESVKNRL